jgi:uncharacterized protein (DUF2249 family)
MTSIELPRAKRGGCGCSCGQSEQLPELDARQIPHAVRHGAILGALAQLGAGEAMVLVAPHDPKPLLRQIEQMHGDGVDVGYLERGPEAWRLQFTRVR